MAALREVADLAGKEAHLFTPAPAYRIPRDTYTDTPLPPDEPFAANPPDGAIIDYYLGHSASSPVSLEILDAQGKLVRKFSSDDKPEATEAELKRQLIPLYWLRPFRALPSDAGMHRWVWDLHYPAPIATRHDYPIAAIPGDTPRYPLGPRALPGSYTVRLTVEGKSYSAAFVVKMDPRVKISAATLQKQFQTETRLASLVSLTSKNVLQAQSVRDTLQKLSEQAHGQVRDTVDAFQKKLATILGALAGFTAPPSEENTLIRANGEAAGLYAQVSQADAEPTVAQTEACAAAERDASEVIKRWEALQSSDLPALNRVLSGASLPLVEISLDLHQAEPVMDED
jgi:hypothetical protein